MPFIKMFRREAFNEFFNRHPLLLIGLVVYSYALVAMVLFQYVLLPAVAPSVSNGLFSGDPQYYNQLAITMAHQISTKGLSAWSLRPAGQGSAGVTAIIYAAFSVKPWLIILLNALLHSLASVVLIYIVRQLVPLKLAVIACLFFIVSPYQMHWLSQINKDSYTILGFYLIVLGWIFVYKEILNSTTSVCWSGLSMIVSGAILISIVRPYMLQVLQVPNIVVVCILSLVYTRCHVANRFGYILSSLFKWLGPVIVVLLVLIPLSKGGASGETISAYEQRSVAIQPSNCWKRTPWIPVFLDKKFAAIISQRGNYNILGTKEYGPTTRELLIDNKKVFYSAYDVAAYLPRAMQLAFFAPFPSYWVIPGLNSENSIFRQFVTIEMILAYISFIFLAIGCVLYKDRLVFILPLIYSFVLMLVYGLATPHISVLYRYRYAPFMLLVSIGFSVALKLWNGKISVVDNMKS